MSTKTDTLVQRLTSFELDPSPEEDVVLFSVVVEIGPELEEDGNGPLPFDPLGLFGPLNPWHCTKPITKMKKRRKVPLIATNCVFHCK